jgi:uncharacterized C2H2 Zn-finger protein
MQAHQPRETSQIDVAKALSSRLKRVHTDHTNSTMTSPVSYNTTSTKVTDLTEADSSFAPSRTDLAPSRRLFPLPSQSAVNNNNGGTSGTPRPKTGIFGAWNKERLQPIFTPLSYRRQLPSPLPSYAPVSTRGPTGTTTPSFASTPTSACTPVSTFTRIASLTGPSLSSGQQTATPIQPVRQPGPQVPSTSRVLEISNIISDGPLSAWRGYGPRVYRTTPSTSFETTPVSSGPRRFCRIFDNDDDDDDILDDEDDDDNDDADENPAMQTIPPSLRSSIPADRRKHWETVLRADVPAFLRSPAPDARGTIFKKRPVMKLLAASLSRQQQRGCQSSQVDRGSPVVALFACSICTQTFRRKYDLKTHVEAVHEKRRPHACPYEACSASFAHRGTMTKRGSSRCIYARIYEIACTRTGIGADLVICDAFSGSFCSLRLRVDISTVHLRRRAFACPVCGSRFSERGNYHKHFARAHPDGTRQSAVTGS